MSEPDLDEAVGKLITVLDTLASLLRGIGEERWAAWVEKSNRHLQNHDLRGVHHLLGAYGGMGSLNDIVAPSIDGPRTEAWELAQRIQRVSN